VTKKVAGAVPETQRASGLEEGNAMPVSLEILLILLLTLTNGVLAMSEIAIVSSRKARLQRHASEGERGAQVAIQLAEEPTRFLSTVQIGISLVGVLAGAFGGATLADELDVLLHRIPVLAPYSGAASLVLVVLGITYLSLVVGELVPKRVALNNAEAIAAAVAIPMQTLSNLASPVVRLLSVSTEVVVRLLGVQPSSEPPVTEQEVEYMIDEGTEVGVFEQVERDIVRRVFRLGDRRVSSLMTHRTEIVWLDLADPEKEILARITTSVHTRFPVARGSLDSVLGVVQAKDLLAQVLAGQALDLKRILRPPVFVPESAPALDVLELFKQGGQPLALVIDEYGGLEGLLTVNDVLEGIVGDLPDEGDVLEPEAVRRRDGSWLLDGMLPVDKFRDLFDLDRLPLEEELHFETLGGFVMAFLGRIPTTSDHFQWRQWCFEIMDMDGHRVDKVLVAPLASSACGEAAGASEPAQPDGPAQHDDAG
jgi:putative hemolysin